MRKMEPPKAQSSSAAPSWAVIAVVLTCSLCIFCAVAQAQQGYNVTLVAKNGDVISGKTILFEGAPRVAINNRGAIAFEAFFVDPACQPGLCEGVFELPRSAPPVFAGRGSVAGIDNSGTILFRCSPDFRPSLCTQSGAISLSGLGGAAAFDFPVISGNGSIVFIAEQIGPHNSVVGGFTLIQNLATPDGVLLRTCEIALSQPGLPCVSGGPAGDSLEGKQLSALGPIAIGASGAPAFVCGFSDGTAGICDLSGILARAGGAIGGITLANLESPALSNSDQLVFTVDFPPNERGVFTPSSVLLKPGNVLGGLTIGGIFGFSQSDRGALLFDVGIAAAPGIEQGEVLLDQQGRIVLRQGTVIGGETVNGIGSGSMNDRGEIVMGILFTGASGGVVLAEPRHAGQ
jgi:hypothetical protein